MSYMFSNNYVGCYNKFWWITTSGVHILKITRPNLSILSGARYWEKILFEFIITIPQIRFFSSFWGSVWIFCKFYRKSFVVNGHISIWIYTTLSIKNQFCAYILLTNFYYLQYICNQTLRVFNKIPSMLEFDFDIQLILEDVPILISINRRNQIIAKI